MGAGRELSFFVCLFETWQIVVLQTYGLGTFNVNICCMKALGWSQGINKPHLTLLFVRHCAKHCGGYK